MLHKEVKVQERREDTCLLGVENRTEIEHLKLWMNKTESKIDDLKLSIDGLKDKYADRLPIWATWAMTVMGTVLGILSTAVVQYWLK